MRAGGRAALILALALGGCRARTTDSTGTTADAGTAARPRPGDLPLPGCDVLMPADMRELTLPGFSIREERACPTCGPLCALRSETEKDVTVSVTWDCNSRYSRTDVRALLAPSLRAGGLEVPALGRAAVRRAPAQGMLQVMTWDDDTPCALIVTWLGGDPERALDVARSALSTTTPAALAMPPPPAEDAGLP
ncbi:hypothetical protein HPC49_09940 [Pyxidicoccus fallax]|uniref:Lipoprotein n=1 Tax=Pyxidicoccus fallax TaxID=394095 RepID=A0A848LIK1_9BACT|nr:hypothetical protein [Pyxidicoccus fallax]NMO17544.1 hypothetical protein [Pyxidicoccus fallax]NPC78562.1 hypothetical protein [Pyxidicoccus fallax]